MPYKEEPARYLHRLLEVVEDGGYDTCACLKAQGLRRDEVANPRARISYERYAAVLERVLEETNIPGLGLAAGRRIPLVDHGILGYAFLSSANLRKAIQIFSKYQKIQGPMVNIGLKGVEAGQAIYAAEPARPLDGPQYRFAVESWLAESAHFRSLFDPGRMCFTSARVAYDAPAWAAEYEIVTKCPVEFGMSSNELRFNASLLDIPFSLAEESVAELCAQQCQEIMNQMSSQEDSVDEVRRALLHSPGAMPNMNQVARQLHLSPRTLRRRLRDARTSFREIIADVRMKLATQYLSSTGLPMAEIAYLLGYSDVTAFHRSFKKHYSTTPAAYREHAAEDG